MNSTVRCVALFKINLLKAFSLCDESYSYLEVFIKWRSTIKHRLAKKIVAENFIEARWIVSWIVVSKDFSKMHQSQARWDFPMTKMRGARSWRNYARQIADRNCHSWGRHWPRYRRTWGRSYVNIRVSDLHVCIWIDVLHTLEWIIPGRCVHAFSTYTRTRARARPRVAYTK